MMEQLLDAQVIDYERSVGIADRWKTKRIRWISAFVEEILIERLDMEMDKVPKRGSFVKTRVASLYIDDVCNYLYDRYDFLETNETRRNF